MVFQEVVRGRRSMGSIDMDVIFGEPENYLIETLTFEVIPFKSTLHAIFGRPIFVAFMARSWTHSIVSNSNAFLVSGIHRHNNRFTCDLIREMD
jgi:hypothetical protein